MAAQHQQHQQQRAAIEELKLENTRLHHELLVQQDAWDAADTAHASWLESQIKLYKAKALQEGAVAQQIQRELDSIRQQLKQQSGNSRQQAEPCKAAGGVADRGKQVVILQERLAHQKQRLDSLNAGNVTKQQQLLNIAKCAQAAQAAAQQLQRQLCGVQEETASLQRLVAAVEATRRQAVQLSELLASQDDAEHLAVSAVAKQVADVQTLVRQQQHTQPCAPASALLAAPGVHVGSAGACACTEEEAAAVLEQLNGLLDEAAGTRCDSAAADAVEDQAGGVASAASCGYGMLVRRLAQLQVDNYRLFLQCSIADWQQNMLLQRDQQANMRK